MEPTSTVGLYMSIWRVYKPLDYEPWQRYAVNSFTGRFEFASVAQVLGGRCGGVEGWRWGSLSLLDSVFLSLFFVVVVVQRFLRGYWSFLALIWTFTRLWIIYLRFLAGAIEILWKHWRFLLMFHQHYCWLFSFVNFISFSGLFHVSTEVIFRKRNYLRRWRSSNEIQTIPAMIGNCSWLIG